MSVLDELLPVLMNMMLNKSTGTFNLCNPGVISHNEILTMYREIVDPYFSWKNFSLEEQSKVLSADRSNNELNSAKILSFYPEVMNIKDSVRGCLKSWKGPKF